MQTEFDESQGHIDALAAEIKATDKDLKAMEAKVANTVDNRRQLMNDRNKEMNNMEEEDFHWIVKEDDSKLAQFFRNSF